MLEVKIEELTKAVIALTELIGKIEAGKCNVDSVPSKPAPVAAPIIEATSITRFINEPIAPVMPAVPSFESAPVVAAPVANCPIVDGKSLIAYVMDVYKALGAEKGAGIQTVLTEMGVQNVNDVKPDQYAAFYSKIEALKA